MSHLTIQTKNDNKNDNDNDNDDDKRFGSAASGLASSGIQESLEDEDHRLTFDDEFPAQGASGYVLYNLHNY